MIPAGLPCCKLDTLVVRLPYQALVITTICATLPLVVLYRR